MWPWEHVAIGYLAYSALSRVFTRSPPTDDAALMVVLGSFFPDLVDKPLSWTFSILPSGTSLAHSVFVAVPVSLAVILVGRRVGRGWAAGAFALGYLCHLPADVAYPVLIGRGLGFRAILWPLVPTSTESSVGFFVRFWDLFDGFLAFLSTPLGTIYLLGELTLLATALAIWVLDGLPGLRLFRWPRDSRLGSRE